MKFWKVGLIVTVVLFLIGLITLLAIWGTFMNTANSVSQQTNTLNANAENRKLYRMSFSGAGTKTLRVTVPANACAKSVLWSILPDATGVTGTIDIGSTSGGSDFGDSAAISNETYDTPGSYGQIDQADGTTTLAEICSTPGTNSIFITVEITSTTPVTFSFELVSEGYNQAVSTW